MSKTIKVKTDYGGCNYITAGKIYEAKEDSGTDYPQYRIKDDDGEDVYIILIECAHLHGHNWEIVE